MKPEIKATSEGPVVFLEDGLDTIPAMSWDHADRICKAITLSYARGAGDSHVDAHLTENLKRKR